MHGRDRRRAVILTTIAVLSAGGVCSTPANAETIENALAYAYRNNPQLNAQRAQARAIDETVPQALSGYRPKVAITANGGPQYLNEITKTPGALPGLPPNYNRNISSAPEYAAQAGITQTLFDGFVTPNKTRAAESQVSNAREALRVMEQTVLLTGASAYMDVVRDSVDLDIARTNVRTLDETLKQTRDRFYVGEVTSTDVSQAESQFAAAQTSLRSAEAQFIASKALYRQVIGTPPTNLTPASPVDRFLPRTLQEAVERGLAENPNVTAAMYGVDVAYLQVKINEGALFPTLAVQASAQQENQPPFGIIQQRQATLLGQLTIPIYQGGAEYSLIRQSKEGLTQQRLSLDLIRNQARQQIVQSWGQLEATRAQVQSAQAQVMTAEAALRGVRDESRVGQRTTLDVLNAEQAAVNARIALAAALHDRVVSSYAVLSGTGRLSAQVLGLGTPIYDPTIHYQQVRDAWFGLRTPEGDPNFLLSSRDVKLAHSAAANAAAASEAVADAGASPTSQPERALASADAKLDKAMTAVRTVAAEPLPPAKSGGAASSLSHPPRGMKTPAAEPRQARRVQLPQEPQAPSIGVARSSNNSGLMPGAQPVVTATGFSRSIGPMHDGPRPRETASKAATSAPAKGKVIAGAQPIVPASNFATAVR
jgi:outer membrane protein